MIERFEDVENRRHGETTIADLADVLKLRTELCQANVRHSMFFWWCRVHFYYAPLCIYFYVLCTWQSVNESQVPDSLLERLIAGPSEFPPVCAIIGGILGQVSFKCRL